MTQTSKTPLLDKISSPADLRGLEESQLGQLADELRRETIDAVSITGGHLGAGLGVIELTVALHYVFDTPRDKIIWDVGHQTYPHKILTGRRDRIRTLRQGGGLSGFTNRKESEYDAFGAAHSSTSISSGLGFAVARDLAGEDNRVVAVIGDGAMTAGMAYEALNNAGARKSGLIVILNDNDMSIAPPVGAMSAYLSRLITGKSYRSMRHVAKALAKKFPRAMEQTAKRAEEYARGLLTGGTLFEELGFYYVGPIDGHNLDHLLPVLKNVHRLGREHPILVHVVTQKGKGYEPAEEAKDKYHGVTRFDVVTGRQAKPAQSAPSYTSVFSQALIVEAEADEKIVAVTAAMPAGTGLNKFEDRFPDRFFDVGIAEQHAITFCGGLACEGYKPFAAIYSTFLQRAYDQVVHDIAIQRLPVRFMLDRAGLVGADGATHQGSYDITYLGCLPGFVLMAASDGAELMHMVATAAAIDDRPSALRFPRGEAGGVVDYYGFIYHGQTMTHIDALCHVWDDGGMWNGRDPAVEITSDGAQFADITAWGDGIVTRGVLLDVPRHRGEPYVTADRPVHGEELREIAEAQGVEVGAGDALIVYSGYEAFREEHTEAAGPGLHASCATFVRDRDVALLGWDLMDARDPATSMPWPVHGVLYSYGVALLDNALLQPLAAACAEEGRYEFMLMVLPLRVPGGTGSPVNPVAMF